MRPKTFMITLLATWLCRNYVELGRPGWFHSSPWAVTTSYHFLCTYYVPVTLQGALCRLPHVVLNFKRKMLSLFYKCVRQNSVILRGFYLVQLHSFSVTEVDLLFKSV